MNFKTQTTLLVSFQITSIKIKTPRLTSKMPTRLRDGLQSLPQLKEITIEYPSPVTALPHFNSIQSLKLIGLPVDFEDWGWLSNVKDLEEIYVTVAVTMIGSRSERDVTEYEPTLHLIQGSKAMLRGLSRDDANGLLGNVMINAPFEVCAVLVYEFSAVERLSHTQFKPHTLPCHKYCNIRNNE